LAYSWGWTEQRLNETTIKVLYQNWKGREDEKLRKEKGEWERLRILGSWVLAPYSKSLTPQKLLSLPWDKELKKVSYKEVYKDYLAAWDKLDKIK
jgi:hypothetical protein